MNDERRKSLRITEKRYVAVKTIKGGQILNDQVFAVLVDLSETGCCLRSGVELAQGTTLEAAVGFDEEIRTMPGVARWCRKLEAGNWELGVEFTRVEEDDRSFLRRVICSCGES
jgi:c-di-GMP-binding flagellar brake protein YcgR